MIVKWKQTWNTLRVEHTGSGELSGEPMLLKFFVGGHFIGSPVFKSLL